MKYLFLLAAAILGASISATAVNVTVTQPGNNQQVGTPFTLTANATTNNNITGWHVYLDGADVYHAGATNSINASLSASAGSHQLVTRAWDSSGAYDTVTQTVTVSGSGGGDGGGGSNGLPTPPGNAIWFNNIEDRSNWNWCHDPGCAGGSGRGSYWMSQHNNSPSRDGSAGEFYNSGVWANALWWQKVGAHNSARNMLWDFWVYLDGNSQHAGQALEYDMFQFVGGYNYMIGTQCNYGAGKWDTWDEASGHWIHSNITCNKFSANTWHHIQWYVTTNLSNHTYTYHTLVVDGQSHTVNITHSAKNLHWGDNMGVQWQLDVNASGQGYHEWVDHASLAIW